MSVAPIARYLVELSKDAVTPNRSRTPSPLGGSESSQNHNPFIDPAARVKDAYARGLADGKAEAEAELQARLEEQQRQFEDRLAAERQFWAADQVDRLAAALAEMQAGIADAAARVLKPFVTTQLRQVAAAELLECLDVLISKDHQIRLHISGPEDLLELIRQRLATKAIVADFVPSPDYEIRIEAGQTILETRLQAWMAKIEEASA